eukprot:scaffold1159_cov215-Pinguiococcus_pyrenoidosus.AAC.2
MRLGRLRYHDANPWVYREGEAPTHSEPVRWRPKRGEGNGQSREHVGKRQKRRRRIRSVRMAKAREFFGSNARCAQPQTPRLVGPWHRRIRRRSLTVQPGCTGSIIGGSKRSTDVDGRCAPA